MARKTYQVLAYPEVSDVRRCVAHVKWTGSPLRAAERVAKHLRGIACPGTVFPYARILIHSAGTIHSEWNWSLPKGWRKS